MERTSTRADSREPPRPGLFEDIWFGFHLLFLAFVVGGIVTMISGNQPTDLLVAGPLGVATIGVFGRNVLRHLK